MLYIGKFINNFKDFYNEINSATLTGAIDVIVVRQPDGSYMCSPFHVRFGKIGVLRSREKVVDIEVNGSPIHIHMKLGESGEAFFVEEVDGENEIPSYLATSPLPDVPNIESELEKMRLSTFFNEESKALSREPCTVNSHFNETESVLNSSSLLGKTDCDKIVSNISSKDTRVTESNKLESNVPNIEETITSGTANNTVNTDSSDEVKTKRKRRKKIAMKKRSKTKDSSVISSSKPINILRHSDILPKEEDLDDKLEEIFQMDDDYADGDAESSKSSGGLSRSVSLPVSANLDDLFKTEWTSRKASTTFTGEFHPFSDGDVTPQSSPVVSRPPSPKSDTEYENQKIDTVTPTDSSAPSWGWGQLPNVPRKISEAQAPSGISADAKNESEQNKDDDSAVDAEKRSMLGGVLNFMRSTKKIRHMPESEGIYLSDLNAEELDPELAALYFPKFKSPYGPPNDQVKDEDTESGKGPSLPHSPHTVEGCYVPGQDSDSDGGISSDQFSKEKCETISYPYSDIAMSLCGGLQDPEIELPEERFLHSLVTFDEFTENPAILQDPNLVIRIGGKYYNWPTAASMLTSIIMFQRPLPEKTANQLINEHMPKKKKSKSYSSWWSWRRADTEIKPETDASPTQLITDASLLSEGMESKIGSAPEEKSYEMEVETCIAVTVEQTVKETVATVTEVVSEVHDVLIEKSEAVTLQEVIVEPPSPCIEPEVNLISPSSESSTSFTSPPIEINTSTREWSDNSNLLTPEIVAQIPSSAKESDSDKTQNKEKYKKSLRLTSEQIAKLNLQEGPNEFVFSVTTAYQGTTKCTCQVFLWNYDDKIVISDIDGTITKSDVLGHILPMVGHSWAQLGVAKLFTKIQDNGYKFLYLSARAIGQARITREYLRRLRQGEICLPDGPLLLSPTSLISALHREVIERKPEEFKISCLKDIQTLFPTFMGNPFYAGFGNKINDTWAYRAVGIPITRVFTINHRGELKLELIQTFQSSYTRLSDEVDHVFPPLKPSTRVNGHPMPIFSSPEEFSYFTYWRDPVPLLSADDMVV